MFKVNNKDTRTTPLASFWYLCYFTPFSTVSIVNFEQVNAGWDHTNSLQHDTIFCP